ncbi:aldehyde oxidase GLOX1-like [Vicia villosa]|uniref:aldehyde oxidase GLOX1-like n=1 Tax=Vicia villosa TaxID=3911 RepID=UPI00273C4401|nr:aldehyde oxidase GLOX1-like [Vicia villosa]
MTPSLFTILLLITLNLSNKIATAATPSPVISGGGQWQLVHHNIGIVGMHMQLLHNDRVIIYDRTNFGYSNISLPNGRCRVNLKERLKTDCTAHSVEYDVASNAVRPLFLQTDVWCSSGAVNPNGTLIQTGGSGRGEFAVRTINPCPTCDWHEFNHGLAAKRWYATTHILPDGRQIIVGGRKEFNYEFYPKKHRMEKITYMLPFLAQTNNPGVENNLYPFVFLNVDGNLFIFANNRAILFDYNNNVVVKTYPSIPGEDPRSFPSTGSAVLLPLRNLQNPSIEAEVLICGGAPKGSYLLSLRGKFMRALNTCARLKITDPNPSWIMETMPLGRVMSDMILLPNGNVLLINGAASGAAGWNIGRDPILHPFLYKPNNVINSRFQLQNPSGIPRMYHSSAILLRDGRVLVAGSNPHEFYNFSNVLFPTELRLETFSPSYLEPQYNDIRPIMVYPAPQSQTRLKYAQTLKIRFQVKGTLAIDSVSVTMLAPSFNTHSFSMNQRLLVLDHVKTANNVVAGKLTSTSTCQVEVAMPCSSNLAPPGYYLLFVVHQEVPSEGVWIQLL